MIHGKMTAQQVSTFVPIVMNNILLRKLRMSKLCLDCRKPISKLAIRCGSCNKKETYKNPENNPNWKGGKPKCLDCGKELVNRVAKRCRKCSKKGTLNNMYGSNRCMEKNPRWIKGVPQDLTTVHRRMCFLYGKADKCENPECTGKSKNYDWSNKKHDYKTVDRNDWQMLCKSCHQIYDFINNRTKELKKETDNVI
jgi:hypothetical protein